MTWPPRWDKPHFKQPIAPKIARKAKRSASATVENKEKAIVRSRDRACRMPLCGCKRFGLAREVSHAQHRGMGGNPKGDRSTSGKMILLCNARHRIHRISIDRGTLRWRPLTRKGSNGPIAWDVDRTVLDNDLPTRGPVWVEVAREKAVNELEPLTPAQRAMLERLAEMQL